MTTKDVAPKLVELCNKHQNLEAVQQLYSKNVVFIEPVAMGNLPAETRGVEGVIENAKWWVDSHIVHGGEATGPFIHGNRFAVKFDADVTFKPSGQRSKMSEAGMYEVDKGKVIHEEFFFAA